MLTKFPVELIRGNGDANMFVAYNGEGMDVSNITVEPGVKIGAIEYDRDNGILKLTIVVGTTDLAITPIDPANIVDYVEIKGFVKLADLKKGMQGKNGRSGKTGINGLNGVDGQKGVRGPRGFRGLRGVQGLPGPRGVQGLRGDQGYKGARGPRGLTGIKGQIGEKGPKGDTGTDGRNSFLPIAVGNTDPGAIGAGGLWVKPIGFNYEQDRDRVPFTVSENKETVICYETIQMLSSLQQTGITPEWFSRDIPTNTSYTYCLTFKSACLSGKELVIVAESESINGITTVVLMNGFLYNLEQHFKNPKCYFDQFLHIAHDKGIVKIDDDVYKVVDYDLNINGYCLIGNTHYIAATDGFYKYQTKLMRLYDDTFESVFVYNEDCYATTSTATYIDNDDQDAFDKKCIVDTNLIGYKLDGDLLHVYSIDNSLLYSATVDSVKENIAFKGNSIFAITSFGLKFITDTNYKSLMVGNYLIEYDSNVMFIELR